MSDNLATALAAFQAEMPTVVKAHSAKVKTKQGGDYTYTYASLADITKAAMPLLTKCGLAFTALPHRSAEHGGYELVGRLLHASGETLEGSLPLGGNSPQELGSSISYMRRYLFGCLTGLVTDDDDDGQLAQQAAKTRRPQRRSEPPVAPAVTGPADSPAAVTDAQLKKMHTVFSRMGIADAQVRREYVATIVGRHIDSSKELTSAEARTVIDQLVKDAGEKAGRLDTTPPDDPWLTADKDGVVVEEPPA